MTTPTCDGCGLPRVVIQSAPDLAAEANGGTWSYADCECGWTPPEEEITWFESAPLTPEREEEIVVKIEAVEPDVCRHCGDALCWVPHSEDMEPHHYGDNTRAHKPHCTRVKLVRVLRGWAGDCPLWRGLGPTKRHTRGVCRIDRDIECAGDEPLPKKCPLLTNGKPGPGVRIVAVIKEDESVSPA